MNQDVNINLYINFDLHLIACFYTFCTYLNNLVFEAYLYITIPCVQIIFFYTK